MATIKLRRGLASEWASRNPVLAEGEPGFEKDTGRFKLGDGVLSWTELEYFETDYDASPGDDGAAMAALQAHIASLSPHPVYDDLPSLVLIYKNAKV